MYNVLSLASTNAEKQNTSHFEAALWCGAISFPSSFCLMLLLFIVNQTFFGTLCMCPLMVAVDGGRCFVTDSLVSTGTSSSWLLLIAFKIVAVVGEKKQWCRYLMVSSCDINTCALFIWWWRHAGACVGSLCCVALPLSGTNHSFFRVNLKPRRTILLLYVIVHWSFWNSTVYPASHSFTTDSSDCCFSCGMMCADQAADGKDGQFI